MARQEIHGRHRSRHRHQYWRNYDKGSYECPECGRGPDEVYWFEVHHKDGDPTNGNPDNLVALCRKCHYEVHDREPPETLDDWKQRVKNI